MPAAVQRGRRAPLGAAYRDASPITGTAREATDVSTRTLLVLAAVTGLAILVAGAVQILLAR